jgi:hypothetical protein
VPEIIWSHEEIPDIHKAVMFCFKITQGSKTTQENVKMKARLWQ